MWNRRTLSKIYFVTFNYNFTRSNLNHLIYLYYWQILFSLHQRFARKIDNELKKKKKKTVESFDVWGKNKMLLCDKAGFLQL